MKCIGFQFEYRGEIYNALISIHEYNHESIDFSYNIYKLEYDSDGNILSSGLVDIKDQIYDDLYDKIKKHVIAHCEMELDNEYIANQEFYLN